MKIKIKLIVIVFICITFFNLNLAYCFLGGDVNGDEKIDLSEAVYALQITSGLRSSLATKTINVPIDFSTIQEAINAASANDTINISAGTYNERLSINKNNLTIQGGGSDVTIINGNSTEEPSITIKNALGVELNDLFVQGGRYGIKANFSTLVVNNCRIENNTKYGIRTYYNSFVEFNNSTVKSTNGGGISVDDGAVFEVNNSEISQNTERGLNATTSTLIVNGSTISGNGDNGINAHDSSVKVYDSIITQNNGNGIIGWNGSRITLYGTQLTLNTYCGLSVGGHSTAHLARENTISNNADNTWWSGIFINHASYVFIGESTNIISSNKGAGVRILSNSTLGMQAGQITGNNGDGVEINSESVAEFFSEVSITNNTGYGVHCIDGKMLGNPGTASGNTQGDLNNCL